MSLKHIFAVCVRYFRKWVVFKGNDTAYLRSLGMQIGNSQLSLRSVHVGSEPWLIKIGDQVTVAHGTFLITHDGASRVIRGKHPHLNQKFGNGYGPIIIEDNCFIGAGAIILPGVTIGCNTVIGAGSVVTRSIPANSVAVGVPARVVRTIEEFEQKHLDGAIIPLNARTYEELRTELTAHFKL